MDERARKDTTEERNRELEEDVSKGATQCIDKDRKDKRNVWNWKNNALMCI